jgi:hypothetical protein
MKSEKPTESESEDRHPDDDAFQKVLAEYLDRLNSGEMIPREEILEEYPELADEILAQLETFQEIGADGGASSELGTFGDYEIVSEIGRGGMGVVYEAIDRHMDRRVALKVLPAGLKIHVKSVVRFRREARIVGKLRHPNIVAVYATGIQDKTPFITMELVEGESLERILERKRPSVDEDTRHLGSRILTGIHRAFVTRQTVPGSSFPVERPEEDLSLPGYRIPLPRGRYRLVLHFAEVDVRLQQPGQRVFNVIVEGQTLLDNHDSLARAGHSTAHRVEHSVSVTDGHLDIEFVRRIELPSISAIEIEALE